MVLKNSLIACFVIVRRQLFHRILLVNGGWSSWTSWSECTASCGGGTKVRLRRCDDPKPMNNGTNCTELGGSSVETATCNVYPCNEGKYCLTVSSKNLATSKLKQGIFIKFSI